MLNSVFTLGERDCVSGIGSQTLKNMAVDLHLVVGVIQSPVYTSVPPPRPTAEGDLQLATSIMPP